MAIPGPPMKDVWLKEEKKKNRKQAIRDSLARPSKLFTNSRDSDSMATTATVTAAVSSSSSSTSSSKSSRRLSTANLPRVSSTSSAPSGTNTATTTTGVSDKIPISKSMPLAGNNSSNRKSREMNISWPYNVSHVMHLNVDDVIVHHSTPVEGPPTPKKTPTRKPLPLSFSRMKSQMISPPSSPTNGGRKRASFFRSEQPDSPPVTPSPIIPSSLRKHFRESNYSEVDPARSGSPLSKYFGYSDDRKSVRRESKVPDMLSVPTAPYSSKKNRKSAKPSPPRPKRPDTALDEGEGRYILEEIMDAYYRQSYYFLEADVNIQPPHVIYNDDTRASYISRRACSVGSEELSGLRGENHDIQNLPYVPPLFHNKRMSFDSDLSTASSTVSLSPSSSPVMRSSMKASSMQNLKYSKGPKGHERKISEEPDGFGGDLWPPRGASLNRYNSVSKESIGGESMILGNNSYI
ncbi:hypothetical protein V1511DRAFT_488937 [Dipodascopsis uninucleata]